MPRIYNQMQMTLLRVLIQKRFSALDVFKLTTGLMRARHMTFKTFILFYITDLLMIYARRYTVDWYTLSLTLTFSIPNLVNL